MGDVVNLHATQEGDARCLHCKHEWTANSPLGVVELECPSCSLMKGAYVGVCVPDEYWECSCDNDLFFVTKDGIKCARCGDYQIGYD